MSYPHPDLTPPAPLSNNGLRVVALGGLGEIGRNMTVFEYHDRLLIVDCGVLFPESDQPGVDLILPDFSYLDGRLDKVEALVLTHAHEDHIGAVPYLLRQRGDQFEGFISHPLQIAFGQRQIESAGIQAGQVQERVDQGAGYVVLAGYVGEALRAIFTCEYLIAHRFLISPSGL